MTYRDFLTGPSAVRMFSVGETTVWALADGFIGIDAQTLQGVGQSDYDALLNESFVAARPHPTAVNAFLIETGDRRILIDAGAGAAMGPTLGHAGVGLAALDVDPESVDTIIVTHLHPDHIGGLAVTNFPTAELIVASADIDFWTSPKVKGGAPADFHPFFDLASSVVASFGDRVRGVSGEADLGPGLTAVPLPGHTPGHMGVMVESSGAQLLLWADIVHVAPIQFARPDVTIAFDGDPDAAAATRKNMLDRVATDRLMVAGTHISFPGAGHLERAAEGYRFIPVGHPYV